MDISLEVARIQPHSRKEREFVVYSEERTRLKAWGKRYLALSREGLTQELRDLSYPESIIRLVRAGVVLQTADGVFGKKEKVIRWLKMNREQPMKD